MDNKVHRRTFRNPFRPGAGHIPPYLAGREVETRDFRSLLDQDTILQNLLLTGLRGLGKTVLLERFKPMAQQAKWLWASADMSESTSVSEENFATRLLTDLSLVTRSISFGAGDRPALGFAKETDQPPKTLNYAMLRAFYDSTPGLVADKVRAVLEFVWPFVQSVGQKGIIFAYDEAQNLSDHAAKEQYPLSLLLDVFQSIQRRGVCFMLVLTGLPTLQAKLVEARTFSERMFHVIFLEPLNKKETRDAIRKPIQRENCPVISDESVTTIWEVTHGYPYFVQYVCKEVFDVWVQATNAGQTIPPVPVNEIMGKLDSDFFAGRWARATDRQRQLLWVASHLADRDMEFTVQQITESGFNENLEKPFGGSHVNQMLAALSDSGLVYKNRHGKYSFAVPLLANFIRRQTDG